MSRTHAPRLLLAVGISLLALLATLAPATAADGDPVAITWPASRVTVDAQAAVTIVGTDLSVPRSFTVYDGTEASVATGVLTAAAPKATVLLSTKRLGTQQFSIGVTDEVDPTGWRSDRFTLTVVRRVTTVSATYPSGRFTAGTKVKPVTGKVSGTTGRKVNLQVATGTGWVTVGETRTASTGRFSVATPTWWAKDPMTMRIQVPETSRDTAASSTNRRTIRVKRSYTPRRGTAYTYLAQHRPRWNPCTAITYRVNKSRMPANGLRDVQTGFKKISEATGLRFRYAGTTTFLPWKNGDGATQPTNADIVIAWATARQVPYLSGGTVGIGGGWSYTTAGSTRAWFSTGAVVFDADHRMRPGFLGTRNFGELVLHELGHAVGLGHVTQRGQIMLPMLQDVAGRYAAGDIRGLVKQGAIGGCAPTLVRAKAPAATGTFLP